MFDPYLIQYILEYLKSCTNCNKYCIINYYNTCLICKNFYCDTCTNHLKRNYNEFETFSNYCEECNKLVTLFK